MSTTNMTSEIDGPTGVSHPTPHNLGRLSTSTLSMRNKKQMKRHANAQHNSNFHAGYVPVTEDVLHRSGIRGRKRYFLYCTISILLFVAVINTVVTACLIYLLGMTHDGVANLEQVDVSSRSFVHFFATTFASTFLLNGVPIGSQYGSNMTVSSFNSAMNIKSYKSSKFSPMISLNESTITVHADLRIRSNDSDKWTSLDVENVAKVHGISNYRVDSLTTRKIQNYKPINDLYLESSRRMVKILGSKGVEINSQKGMEFSGRNILVLSDNSTVVFQSKRSIYLDPNLNKVTPSSSSSRPQVNKICACGNGRLFLVHGTSSTSCDIGKDLAISVCRL